MRSGFKYPVDQTAQNHICSEPYFNVHIPPHDVCYFGSPSGIPSIYLTHLAYSTTGSVHHAIMVVALRAVAALLCWVTGTAYGARLLVSHYSSSVFVLTLTPANGGSAANLAVSSEMPDGPLPGWLTADSTSGTFYLSDESALKTPPPLLAQLQFGESNSLGVVASAIGSPGQVHSTLYGGVDGRGFIAVAQ